MCVSVEDGVSAEFINLVEVRGLLLDIVSDSVYIQSIYTTGCLQSSPLFHLAMEFSASIEFNTSSFFLC